MKTHTDVCEILELHNGAGLVKWIMNMLGT